MAQWQLLYKYLLSLFFNRLSHLCCCDPFQLYLNDLNGLVVTASLLQDFPVSEPLLDVRGLAEGSFMTHSQHILYIYKQK